MKRTTLSNPQPPTPDRCPTPTIAVTLGDPAGIGPELCLDLWQQTPQARILVVGHAGALEQAAEAVGRPGPELRVMRSPDDRLPLAGECVVYEPAGVEWRPATWGVVTAESGAASFAYLEAATELVLSGRADALVTGPIHKSAWQRAGIDYPGHTEYLVQRTGATRHAMMLTSPDITVSLVTTHVGLDEVAGLICRERIVEVIRLTHEALLRRLDRPPRLAVLGLNPHAGEGGRFGNDEEGREIEPAVVEARGEGIDVDGPLPPDTAFLLERRRRTDGYVCMYHDQGLIPLKTLAFDHGVNVTLGLPIVRTSVDHGPALDIAGRGLASSHSLLAAVQLATELVCR